MSEDWKRYFLSASTSCQKGPLLAENIKGSSVEINVNELSLPSEITYKMGHFTLEGLKQKQYFLVLPLPAKKVRFR